MDIWQTFDQLRGNPSGGVKSLQAQYHFNNKSHPYSQYQLIWVNVFATLEVFISSQGKIGVREKKQEIVRVRGRTKVKAAI